MHVLMLSVDPRILEDGSDVRERMKAYAKLFDSLVIVVFSRARGKDEKVGEKIFVYSRPAIRWPWSFFFACWTIVRIRGELRVSHSVVTSQDAVTHPIGIFLKYWYRVPLQLQVHTDFLHPLYRNESLKNYLRYLLYFHTIRRADCLRVVSDRIKSSIERAFRRTPPITLLPIFVDPATSQGVPRFDLRQRFPSGFPIIVMVSRLSKEKDIDLALRIFSRVQRELRTAKLVIVGDGPERGHLEARVRVLGLEAHVRFEGWQKDLVPFYRGADIFLFTSRYEGYGRVLIEAARAGVAIASTPVGIVGDILKPGESVLTFSNENEGIKAVIELAHNHATRKQISSNAEKAVGAVTSFESYCLAYKKSLESCGTRAF